MVVVVAVVAAAGALERSSSWEGGTGDGWGGNNNPGVEVGEHAAVVRLDASSRAADGTDNP